MEKLKSIEKVLLKNLFSKFFYSSIKIYRICVEKLKIFVTIEKRIKNESYI